MFKSDDSLGQVPINPVDYELSTKTKKSNFSSKLVLLKRKL